MVRPFRAVLLAVGNELLSGRTRDANLHFLGGALNRWGLPLSEARVVRDDLDEIVSAVRELLLPGTLLVITGGLGPTSDDITLEGMARALGLPLRVCPAAADLITGRYLSVGERVPEGALKQALLPEGSIPVENPAGVAPGVVLHARGGVVFSLPGVPREARELFPVCLSVAGIGQTGCSGFQVRTWGIREIDLYNMIRPIQEKFGLSPAYLPNPGRVDLSFDGPGAPGFRDAVVSLLGPGVYSLERDLTLEGVLGLELKSRGLVAATAESCTGGLVSAGLTGVPGASEWFAGGVSAYSNLSKTRILGVPEQLISARGAVSCEVAVAMALGVRDIFGAHCGVSVTGIAGPSGGTPDKPVGTVWIAACCGPRTTSATWRFGGARDTVRLAASSCAVLLHS
ncbi:MAG: nicotinamide-nucleotide amidohydrolase family protein, partial [Candidatus Fermentibacteraceae bacterium]